MGEYVGLDGVKGGKLRPRGRHIARTVDIRAKTVSLVTTRKPQKCHGYDGFRTMHDIPKGTRARFEKAIVDGDWGSCYVCTECMDKWLNACDDIHHGDSK